MAIRPEDLTFIVGERVRLRSLTESDVDGPYVTWFNDEEVCRGNSHHVFPFTREAALEYVRRSSRARDALVLAIIIKADGRHIGNVALQGINWVDRSAEFAIVIGDRGAWSSGYGTEAGRLVLAHGFSALNLNRIACGTFEDNDSMKKLALRLGMREEGRRRKAVFKAGRFLDLLEFGVLQEEYVRNEPRPY